MFVAVSAIVPSFLIGWYFHKRDWYPEPPKVLWATFGLGVLSVIVVVPVELLIGSVVELVPLPVVKGFLDAFLVAAIPEEFFKLAVLLGYAYRHREFNEPMDGIVYGVMAALGFATLENVLYVFEGGIGVAVMRALTAVPSHATEGAIMGYFVGRAKFAPAGRAGLILTGFISAVVLHGFYDFPLLSLSAAAEAAGADAQVPPAYAALVLITVAALVVSLVSALVLTRRLRKEQIAAAPPSASVPASAASKAWAMVLLVIGGLLACAGGVLCLGLALILVAGGVESGDVGYYLVGSAIIGGLPLILGIILFTVGIVKLNHASPPPVDLYRRPPGWPPPAYPPPPLSPPSAGPPGAP
jgi:RsiW-degrading membrane proteinase PrsW (M82 family)